MKTLAVIPARFASTRLPGKPLVDISGKPMIQYVYEKVSQEFENVVVATDDTRILNAVQNFGGEAAMTSTEHNSGTNRCLEAYQIWKEKNSEVGVILNCQGDEPLLEPTHLQQLVQVFADENVKMATLATPIKEAQNLDDENRVFLTRDQNSNALYFSRLPIPFLRNVQNSERINQHKFLQHLGIYAYHPDALQKFASMPESSLERAEKLEQLRWLEAGEKIRVEIVSHASPAVDTPEDLEKVRQLFASK